MNRRHFLRLSLGSGMVASAAMLAGCGFQLRGTQRQTHIPPLTLEGETRSLVARAVSVELNTLGNGVSEDADWRLTLSTPELTERRLGSEGRGSREHEFTLSVQVSVQQRNNNAYALNVPRLSVSARQRLNDDDLLDRESVIEELRIMLSKRLAQRVIQRITVLEAFDS